MAKKKSAADGVGQKIRVKPGIASPEFPDISIEGWTGMVAETSGKAPAVKFIIEWDDATVDAMPKTYIERCEAQQLYYRMACLDAEVTEPA